ncbi:hypothetical protein L6164_031089 [Bauhinia variegata]|uniref:Uncharacterized protein n=1 Tax=Bauhinia variegata TaxID=167791 RepID=A0ACB9LEI9_BAUVA|nr:hypothetical protein L6164_031089 [Bauhinia variegata]
MNVLHRWNEELGRALRVDEGFIAYGNGFDFGGGIEMGDVCLDPRVGERLVSGGGGQKLIGHSYDDAYIRVGKGREHSCVSVEKLEPVDPLSF